MNSTLSARSARALLQTLIGVGDRIWLATLPFLVVGLIANIAQPSWFRVGGPPTALGVVSVVLLTLGVATWAWSVAMVVTQVPKGRLMTHGPYAVVLHPLYTAVALLVLPWLGFLLDSWLGAALGAVMYVASRIFVGTEEQHLSRTFGDAWTEYRRSVWIPWL